MYIVKSAFVLGCLLTLAVLSAVAFAKCAKRFRHGLLTVVEILLVIFLIGITVAFTVLFGDYVYPFERTLEPVLVAEFDVPEGYELDYPGQRFWHGAYAQFGLYAGAFWFDPDAEYAFGWPPMDFGRYCYIITYGQKIETLS